MKKIISKKRKISTKKKITISVVSVVIVIVIVILASLSKKDMELGTSKSLENNQELVYGKITQISGNEITYTVYTLSETDAGTQSEIKADTTGEFIEESQVEGDGEQAASGSRPSREESQVEGDGEQAASGSRPSREESQVEGDEEQAASGTRPSREETQEEGEFGAREITDIEKNKEIDGMEAKEEELENITIIIPVGTEVTTKLGTVTTFSRLVVGDIIEMVVEKTSDGLMTIISIEIVE